MKTLQKTGRPTSITSEIETKLESILKIGGTISEATSYAGIGERTYYDRASVSEDFSQKMNAAKHYADIVAKNVVVDNIVKDKNIESAKWWLEKREFKQGQPFAQQNIQINVHPAFLKKYGTIQSPLGTTGSNKE